MFTSGRLIGAALAILFLCIGVSGCVRSMVQSSIRDRVGIETDKRGASNSPDSPLQEPIRSNVRPKDAGKACFQTAESLAAHGHDAEAIRLFLRARSLTPKLTGVAHRLAVLYDRQGNDQRAREEYQAALRATPRDAELLNDVGYFHYQRGRLEEAQRYLQQAIEQSPQHQRAHVNLAMVYARQGRYEESFRVFSEAVGPAAAHANLGIIHAQSGRIDDAKRHLNQALALDPSLPQPAAILTHLSQSE